MSQKEITFNENEFIISKTDSKGIITYCNELFTEISGYTEDELFLKPHSILRHPDMPKFIFQYLWDELRAGREVFAYVKNKTKNNDFYWVLAFVTPSLDNNGNLIEYFSVRRKPTQEAIAIIEPLYKQLLHEEKKAGINASKLYLTNLLNTQGVSYEQFIFSV